MAEIKLATTLPVGADQLWDAIGNFNALPDWHPGVEKSELEEGGTVRRLSLMGGGEIVERLEAKDDADHTYSYSIVSSPLPVINYSGTIKVTPTEDGKAEVEWSGNFDTPPGADDATKIIQDTYQAGLDNLKKMFGG